MIKLAVFKKEDYSTLISWIETEEMLLQFGGPLLRFPLDEEQLDASVHDPNRFSFAVIETCSNEVIGHAEILVTDTSAKIGRIIIGKQEARGKGYCAPLMNELIRFTFSRIDRVIIELNVFEFNKGAIRCYEKVGFRVNPEIRLERKLRDQTWIGLNMILDIEAWHQQAVIPS